MYPSYAKFDFSKKPKLLLNYTDIFKTIKILGKGNFGETQLIADKSNKKYALKILYAKNASIDDYYREVNTLISLSNPCTIDIVCYYDFFSLKKNNNIYFCILTEYIQGVTLKQYDETHILSYNNILSIGLWLLNVVKKLHSKGIAHNDISIENIMVTNKGQLKLIDFGLSCNIHAKRVTKCVTDRLINNYYISPEMTSGKFFTNVNKYSKTSDIFTIGLIIYELITFRKPYLYDKESNIISNYIHIKNANCLDYALHHMLYINPDTRATVNQAYKLLYKCYNV